MFKTLTKNFTEYVCQNDSENLSNLFSNRSLLNELLTTSLKPFETNQFDNVL